MKGIKVRSTSVEERPVLKFQPGLRQSFFPPDAPENFFETSLRSLPPSLISTIFSQVLQRADFRPGLPVTRVDSVLLLERTIVDVPPDLRGSAPHVLAARTFRH